MKEELDFRMLGVQFKKYREEKGYSMNKLAKEAGVSVSHIKNIESANSRVSLNTFYVLMKILGVTPNDLLFDSLSTKQKSEIRIMKYVEKLSNFSDDEIECVTNFVLQAMDAVKNGGKGDGR